MGSLEASQVESNNNDGNDRVTEDKKPNKPLVTSRAETDNGKPTLDALNTVDTIVNIIDKTYDNKSTSESLERSSANNDQTEDEYIDNRDTEPGLLKKISVPNRGQTTTPDISVLFDPSINYEITNNESCKNSSATDSKTESLDRPPTDFESARMKESFAELYKQFTVNTDSNLDDARMRLQIALDQTRQLRAAFTERVYGKYRICLQPPPRTEEIINKIREDPNAMYNKLQHEIHLINEEKSFEKKEPQIIESTSRNVRLSATTQSADNTTTVPKKRDTVDDSSVSVVTSNADINEQYTYVTSGHKLIVLPEDEVPGISFWMYQDRSPINPDTGQKVRGISATAATSGKAIIDRARLGKIERAELEKSSKKKGGPAT